MATIRQHVGKDGKTTYQVQIRKSGARPIFASFERLSDAKDWAVKEEARLQRRRYGLESIGRHTVAQAIDRFLTEELPLRRSDVHHFRSMLGWWRDEIGHFHLRSLTPRDLAAARDKLLLEPRLQSDGTPYDDRRRLKPATVKMYLALLSIVFSTAMKKWEGWLDENPMTKVDKPEVHNERCRCLSGYYHHFPGDNAPVHWNDVAPERKRHLPADAYELPRLLEACQRQIVEARKEKPSAHYRASSYHPEWLYNLVVLRVSTGLRPTEAVELKWSSVDLYLGSDLGRATIGRTKNGDPLTVPLVGEALLGLREMHKERRPDCDWVFPRKDGLRPLDFRARFERAVKDAGIRDLRPHDLRHTAGSYLAMAGGSLPEIMAALNHKTPQMTKRYMHFSAAHTAGLVARMNTAVFGGRGAVSRFDQQPANDNKRRSKKRA